MRSLGFHRRNRVEHADDSALWLEPEVRACGLLGAVQALSRGPNRNNDCRDNFIKPHAETLRAVDFVSAKSVSIDGIRDLYLTVFLCLETREVIVTESTEHPNSAWVVEQAKSFLNQTLDREQGRYIMMHDRDTKFSKEFTKTLVDHGVLTNKSPITSPSLSGC